MADAVHRISLDGTAAAGSEPAGRGIRRDCHQIADLAAGSAIRAMRQMSQAMPTLMAAMSPTLGKNRLVYDAKNTDRLPGSLVRSEGDKPCKDASVDEAYNHSGKTYDFYEQVLKRNSLDDNGRTLISTVHFAEVDDTGTFISMNNALWNGRQVVCGDGDGVVFRRFTRSLDVIAQ